MLLPHKGRAMQQRPSVSTKNRILSRLSGDDAALLKPDLSRDRRTLGRALRGVRADGTRSGYPGWFIETVLRALGSRDKARGDDGPTPRGFEVIDRVEN